MTRHIVIATAVLALWGAAPQAKPMPPLALEAKIPLGAVTGRVDHMAIDLARKRLFIAELGNDSLAVVDLERRAVIHTIGGLSKPQGVGYLAATDTIYVANGGDGSVRLFAGRDFAPTGRIALDHDADNVRTDEAQARVYVGHGGGGVGALIGGGGGGIAVIGFAGRLIGDIKLPVHPESFQVDAASRRIDINLPDAAQIGIVDPGASKLIATWPLHNVRANFPMALDRAHGWILIGTWRPPRLIALAPSGAVAATAPLCGDADDAFVDAKRSRVYVSCGEGMVAVFATDGARLGPVGQVPTARGARTSLWVPALDRLFVAARAAGGAPAAIWVFRPVS
ncbi:MAG: hypothetical protein KGL11_00425 [Alphaproteobacteria bacterium]|nr:hypothetical protein [Alphaproteobacteria bacterium]